MLSSGSSAWRLQSSPLNPPQVVYQGLWKYTAGAAHEGSLGAIQIDCPSTGMRLRDIKCLLHSVRGWDLALVHGWLSGQG